MNLHVEIVIGAIMGIVEHKVLRFGFIVFKSWIETVMVFPMDLPECHGFINGFLAQTSPRLTIGKRAQNFSRI